jgi:hypothetical protein
MGSLAAEYSVAIRERSFVEARSVWVPLAVGREFHVNDWRLADSCAPQGAVSVALRTDAREYRSTAHAMTRVPPTARDLRRGLQVEFGGGQVATVGRNGPRPLSRWRAVRISGPGIDWRANGSWVGTQLVDLATGEVLFRSKLDSYRIQLPADGDAASVLLVLIAAQVPQSLSPFFWKNSV